MHVRVVIKIVYRHKAIKCRISKFSYLFQKNEMTDFSGMQGELKT